MQPEDSRGTLSAGEKAHRAEERRMRWLDRFPGNPLVHLLVFSRGFRLAMVAFLMVPVIALLTLPRIWTTSPRGVTPVVKVSVVDLIQAWSLQRAAVRRAAEGKDEEAARSWQMALANNRADLELVRANLRHAIRSDRPRSTTTANALGLIPWLLHLGGTNRADVALAAQVCDRFDLPEQALALLKFASAEPLTPEEEVVNLKSLFRTGRFTEFGVRWDRHGQPFEGHPELSLYRAAYLAGWGQPGQMSPAAERLAEAALTPAAEVLASRLQLAVFAKLMDAEGYGQALARLERAHADALGEQIGYWRLLASLGRTARARELADAYVARVGSASEVVQLAKAYLSLDMADRARALLDHYGPQYGDSDSDWATEMWLTYAGLLVEARDWTALEQLAVRLRALKRAGPALTALSYLFEGRAHLGQGGHDQATAALARTADFTFPNGRTGLQAGRSLIELGYPEIALKVLAKIEGAQENEGDYWRAVFEAVYAIRQDAAALVLAARKASEYQPDDTTLMSNHAAALLINRQEPDEALRLTLTVLGRRPESVVALVNHAFALILNQRFDEAEAALERIHPASLNDQQRTFYHLALAEARIGRQQFQAAGKELDLIQSKYLFPNQLERVGQLKKQVATALDG